MKEALNDNLYSKNNLYPKLNDFHSPKYKCNIKRYFDEMLGFSS